MPTITSKCVIKEMLKKNGHYSSGPQALAIYKYQVGATITRWFVAYDQSDLIELASDPSAHNVELLWQRPSQGEPACVKKSGGTSTTP